MSIDLSWSANSLQAPVHAQLQRLNAAVPSRASRLLENQVSRLQGRILPHPLPTQGPWAAKAQTALEQRVLNQNNTGTPFPVTNKLGTVQQPSITPPNPTAAPVKVVQPGLNPELSTAVPEIPDKIDSAPKLAPISGWLSPGANFQIR
jgi:hypothetical protein